MTTTENLIERDLIAKLEDLKYTYRHDIRDRTALEKSLWGTVVLTLDASAGRAIAGVRRSSLARHHHASVSSPVED
jgi:hypothetical protein